MAQDPFVAGCLDLYLAYGMFVNSETVLCTIWVVCAPGFLSHRLYSRLNTNSGFSWHLEPAIYSLC